MFILASISRRVSQKISAFELLCMLMMVTAVDVYLHCRFDAGDWFWVPADGPILDAMEAYYVKSGQQRANPEQVRKPAFRLE